MERIEGLMIDGKISIEEEGMPSAPTRPPLSFPLWRYMSLEQYIHTLLTGGLFFSSPHQLDDPFEGSLPAPTIERLRSQKTAQDIENRTKKQYVISCWHEIKHESDAMWRLYAGRGCGIAVKTDFKSLLNFVVGMDGPDTDYMAGRVEYVDYATEDIPILYGMSLFYKRKSFSHEREVRIVCYVQKNLSDGGMLWKGTLDELIHEIVVSPLAEGWMYDVVLETTKRFSESLAEKVRNSTLPSEQPCRRFLGHKLEPWVIKHIIPLKSRGTSAAL